MELIRRNDIAVFSNSGVESHQLLFPENSSSSRVTVTKVVVAPGAVNPPHRHEKSEQIWVAISGAGILLLGDERTLPFREGDVVRFAEGDLHGDVGDPPVKDRGALVVLERRDVALVAHQHLGRRHAADGKVR